MAKKSEENPALQSFREFVKKQAAQRNLSMRKLSLAIGMAPSYFSEILSGKKRINVDFLNTLADYLQIPRVDVYEAAGWLDPEEDSMGMNSIKDWYSRDPFFRQAMDSITFMDEVQRSSIFKWILLKTLQETNRLQTPPFDLNVDEAIKAGQLQPDAIEKLTPKERKALSGAVQLILETFMSMKDQEQDGEDDFLDDDE